jgi:hypothetical protein
MKATWQMAGLVLLLVLARGEAQFGGPGRPDGDGRPGPWDNDVLVYRMSNDGRSERLATFARAGVPAVARLKSGKLIAAFQHFPKDDDRNFDRVAASFSSDEGQSWSQPEPIHVEGLEQGLARPFDPTLVPLPDGRIRLYFTSNRSPDFRRSTPAIYSAVSDDGVDYQFEPGIRFALDGRIVIDCAVALHEGEFHLIVPDNGTAEQMAAEQRERRTSQGGGGYHAISWDGLFFARAADVKMPGRDRWLGNMQSDGGKLVFFGTGAGPWPLTSSDGKSWEASTNAMRIPGADPGAVKLKGGRWLLLVTSPPRPGTPSERNRSQPPRERF